MENTIHNFMDRMIKNIRKAEEQAYLKGIETNAIILNENHAYVKEFYVRFNECITRQVPPMILGKTLFIGPLPDNWDFALCHVKEEVCESELERLKRLINKYVKTDGQSLRFKNISYKKNEKDFEYIMNLLEEKGE